MTTHDTNEQDIHLDTLEGLAHFVSHITEQYSEFKAAASAHEENVAMMVTIKEGKDAYGELHDAIAVAKAELSEGGEVSESSVEAIQTTYDTFADAYVRVTEVPVSAEATSSGDEQLNVHEETAAITPRFAIRERFEQSIEDIETATAIYKAPALKEDETTLPHLTFLQLSQYRERIQELLRDLAKVDNSNQKEISYLHEASLEIEAGVLRVAAALEDFFPDYEPEEEQVQEETVPKKSKEPIFSKPVEQFLTDRLREDEDIQAAVHALFPSVQVFEKTLWQYVARVEEPSKLDKVLRVTHGSIFKEILKGMTLAEVDAMKALDGEQIRTALIEMQHEDEVQYDYTIFTYWMDEYDLLKSSIETYQDMYFEELIAIAELVRRDSQPN